MKICKNLLLVLFISLFTGCFAEKEVTKDCKCEPQKTEIIYRTTTIKVAVKQPRPKISCNLNTPEGYLKCIILHKKIIEELTVDKTKPEEVIIDKNTVDTKEKNISTL